MSYDALIKGRHSLQNQVYCITTVTRNRLPLFRDFTTARLLVGELRNMHEHGQVVSLAWVIMPDHLHWMIQLKESWHLCGVVKALKARSARSINRYFCQRGSLWQRAYYDRAARRDEDIRQIARYIVANPLRAGLVDRVGDYPHWDCIWMTGHDERVLVE